jgi:DNA segregation ATPase FtsK/SpoIIIE-like protein
MPGVNGTARWALAQLLERGREAGIHLIVCAQGPDDPAAKELAEANFPVQLVGRVTSPAEAGVVTGNGETGARQLRRPGDFVAMASGKTTPFQAAHISARELAEMVCQTLRVEHERQRSGTHAQVVRTPPKQSASGRWQRVRYVGRLYRTLFKYWLGRRKT